MAVARDLDLHHATDELLFLCHYMVTNYALSLLTKQRTEEDTRRDRVGGDSSANRRSPFRLSLAPEVSAKVEFTTRNGFCRGHRS